MQNYSLEPTSHQYLKGFTVTVTDWTSGSGNQKVPAKQAGPTRHCPSVLETVLFVALT